jgi:transcriptional/translational regulatory protein YebC/TACO1
MLNKHSGKLGERNSVARLFHKRGQIIIEKAKADEDALMAVALEAGADDMVDDGDSWDIVTRPEGFGAVREAIGKLNIEPVAAARCPTHVRRPARAQSMIKLMDALEDHDDVQHVWANFDIEEKDIEASLA